MRNMGLTLLWVALGVLSGLWLRTLFQPQPPTPCIRCGQPTRRLVMESYSAHGIIQERVEYLCSVCVYSWTVKETY